MVLDENLPEKHLQDAVMEGVLALKAAAGRLWALAAF